MKRSPGEEVFKCRQQTYRCVVDFPLDQILFLCISFFPENANNLCSVARGNIFIWMNLVLAENIGFPHRSVPGT